MTRLPSVRVWVVFLVSAVGEGGRAAEPDKEKTAAEQRRIATLLLKLGDREYAEREAAVRGLVEIGEPALPAVRRAADTSGIPEVVERAGRVARRILLNARVSKSTGLVTVLASPGEFAMGTPAAGEPNRRPDETQHRVVVSRPFLIGKYEVTQDEYQKVMKVNPSYFAPAGGGKAKVGERGTGQFPVEMVSWFDAVEFCNRLSEADGHPPYYTLTAVKTDADTASIQSATVTAAGGRGFRLPTEAEWEYACRADTRTPFHFGRTAAEASGNFKAMVSIGYGSQEKPSLGRTGKVGGYAANAWGLHDVHGNAAEWCGDWYHRNYGDRPPEDPAGPDQGDHKVVRGGSWMVSDANCRSAARFYLAPAERKEYVGFRVARTP